jgi:hypothetical protein
MAGKKEDETCPCCKRGNLSKQDREIALATGPTKDMSSVAHPTDWRLQAVWLQKIHRFGQIHCRSRCSSGVQKLP